MEICDLNMTYETFGIRNSSTYLIPHGTLRRPREVISARHTPNTFKYRSSQLRSWSSVVP